jgi:exonuclease SbcD
VKLLHTSDWHVGRAIRGHSRAAEHRAVIDEITAVAASEAVDLVVVAGDLFDSAAPTAESERLVYHGLLGLAEVAPVVAVAGNHDNAGRLDAVTRLLALGRVTLGTVPRPPTEGGVMAVEAGDGTPVQVALVPFVSQRAIVRADALMSEPAFRNAQTYAERLRAVLAALSAGFGSDTINLIVAHLFVAGGVSGGGERAAHLVEEYAVAAVDFPVTASYVALGHLHRPQALAGATSIHYCGSPLQLDFGEEAQPKQVNVVTMEPGLPAKVRPVPLTAGRSLLTLSGTMADLEAMAPEVRGGANGGSSVGADGEGPWLRVRVREPARPGLADEVRALLGDAVVEVRVEDAADTRPRVVRRDGRTPSQLFAAYLDDRTVTDPRLQRAFDALHDAAWSGDDEIAVDLSPPTESEPTPAPAPAGTEQLTIGL